MTPTESEPSLSTRGSVDGACCRFEEIGERLGPRVVVELLVVQFGHTQMSLAPPLGGAQSGGDVVNSIHGARIDNVVGRDERRVQRTGHIGVEQLVEEVTLGADPLPVPEEDTIGPEVLRPWIGVQILPLRSFGIGRWIDRARTDVAETAGHPDAVRSNQIIAQVVVRICIIRVRVPIFLGLLIESGVGKEAQPDDA